MSDYISREAIVRCADHKGSYSQRQWLSAWMKKLLRVQSPSVISITCGAERFEYDYMRMRHDGFNIYPLSWRNNNE